MYVQAIKEYGEKCLLGRELVDRFGTWTGKKFWRIMARHVGCVGVGDGMGGEVAKLYL
jgi:hypothetical protein